MVTAAGAGAGQQQTQPRAVTAKPAGELVDINSASAAQLTALPGMGKEYARRVIANRPYRAKNQLSQLGILPDAEYERIKDLIVAHRTSAKAD
jgi:DNA uptake protein ComE-like DNA-binding protein